MSDDAEFDAFLKGEDALSRRLQALPAPAPSAALDAAILQRARDLLAQEARPPAANDAGLAAPAPRLGRLSWRWRLPAGIAATVLTGVFAHQAFQGSPESGARLPAEVNAPAALILEEIHAPPPPPPAEVVMPAKPAMQAPAAPPAPAIAPPAAREEAPASAAPPMDKAVAVQAAPMANAAPAPLPAPVVAAPEYDSKLSRRAQEAESARSADDSLAKRKMDTAQTPAAWVASIEALLAAGKQDEALDQWHLFRKAHPYYVVRHATVEKLEALDQ